jgi:hypothetical protein
VDEQDVQEDPTKTLRQVMALAADRDIVARQYYNGFVEVCRRKVERTSQVPSPATR